MGALIRLWSVLVQFALVLLLLAQAPVAAEAGDLFHWSRESKRENEEWWALEATNPPGARQKYKYGKFWPPRPRPTGKPQAFVHAFHHAHYWPYPYQHEDQVVVRDFSQRQVNNGWIEATTLYGYHFERDSDELSSAGRLHLKWILQETPPNYRFAFVAAADTAEQSQARLANTKRAAAEMVGEENVPPILIRVASAHGRPAVEVDMIRKAELQSMPEPRIEYNTDTPGGGS